MLAHSRGQTLNASQLYRSLGVTDKTIRSYLDILMTNPRLGASWEGFAIEQN